MIAESMNDPRMAELQFLAEIEKRPLQARYASKHHQDTRYGLSDEAFNNMVMHLLSDGFVNDLAEMTSPITDAASWVRYLPDLLRHTVNQFLRQQTIHLAINHKGRLRLWSLRDELQKNRSLEEGFGILLARKYWERDFEIAFAFNEVPVSLIMADLDHFKEINDQCGHQAGDVVVRAFHQIVKDAIADLGEAYRYGGDEVLIILKNADKKKAKAIAEMIRQQVESQGRSKEETQCGLRLACHHGLLTWILKDC
jgi:diguanylate cyclase (GGDEF)-like protein